MCSLSQVSISVHWVWVTRITEKTLNVRCSQDLSVRPLLVSTSLDLDIAAQPSGELWWRRNIDGVTAAAVVSDALLVYVICRTVEDRRGNALVARITQCLASLTNLCFPSLIFWFCQPIFLQHVRCSSSIQAVFTAAILSLLSATLQVVSSQSRLGVLF